MMMKRERRREGGSERGRKEEENKGKDKRKRFDSTAIVFTRSALNENACEKSLSDFVNYRILVAHHCFAAPYPPPPVIKILRYHPEPLSLSFFVFG